MSEARDKALLAKRASVTLGQAAARLRSRAIDAVAGLLQERSAEVIEANLRDLQRARQSGMPEPLQDRLMLDEKRIGAIASAMREVARQDDPIGRVLDGRTLDNGLLLERVSVPLGVVAIVYEARPNVTADSFALCLRSGNACVLKGGSAAQESCRAIAKICREALVCTGLPGDAVQYVEDDANHTQTDELLHATGIVDVLIPRGGASLIKNCVMNSQVPVIETGTGNCHVYVHRDADFDKARAIVMNAKTQRTGVCNAAESLLVDASIAEDFLPLMLADLMGAGVLVHADQQTLEVMGGPLDLLVPATEEDWGHEYLSLQMSVRCVSGVDEAIALVNQYGTGHSECVVTESYGVAERFLAEVDAAVVYANASTRFSDGGVFGLGGEIGISTQKLHARGPMGASALTSSKYLVRGCGQTR